MRGPADTCHFCSISPTPILRGSNGPSRHRSPHRSRSDRYNTDPLGGVEFDGNDYQTADGGLAILPYASSDLEASALAAIIGPERFNASRLESYLSTISGNERKRASVGSSPWPALPDWDPPCCPRSGRQRPTLI